MAPPRLSLLAFALLCAFAGSAAANPTGATVVDRQGRRLDQRQDAHRHQRARHDHQLAGLLDRARRADPLHPADARAAPSSTASSARTRPSLLGRLQSNGRVFLINPNGIVFGAGARIDVGGLVASTLDLGDADFLAGRLNFAGPASAGALTQLGQITTASRRPGAADRAAAREQRRHHLAAGRDPARRRPQRAARRHRQSGPAGDRHGAGRRSAEPRQADRRRRPDRHPCRPDRPERHPERRPRRGRPRRRDLPEGQQRGDARRRPAGSAPAAAPAARSRSTPATAHSRPPAAIDAAGSDGGGGAVRLLGRDVAPERRDGRCLRRDAAAARSWSAATTRARTRRWPTLAPPK